MIPPQLHSTALIAIEGLINQALQYDPTTQSRLAELAGKVIAINSTLPELNIFIACGHGDISLHPEWDDLTDVEVTGSAVALLSIALKDIEQNSLLGSGVEIRGSLDLLQRIKNIFSDLDVDWEAALAKLFGDIPAHLIATAGRSLHGWQQDSHQRIGNVIGNFIKEESRLTPNRVEMEQFILQTRHLATDVDRLTARYNRIMASIAKTSESKNDEV